MSLRLRVVPFGPEHLESAAHLLADQQRRQRLRLPNLPATVQQFDRARQALAGLPGIATGDGAVALRGDEFVGYLIGTRKLFGPLDMGSATMRPRAVVCDRAGWAISEEDGFDVLRALYAELAGGWVADGYFAHYATVSAGSDDALRAWFSLGFGQDMAALRRDIGADSASSPPEGVIVRPATQSDLPALLPLAYDLERHHATAPMFWPYFRELIEGGWETAFGRHLSAPERESQGFIALRDGEIVSYVQLIPSSLVDPLGCVTGSRSTYVIFGVTAPGERGAGVGRATLSSALGWAVARGITECLLHVHTANISGARFWRANGFTDVEYRLCRFIDERVLWAHGSGGV
jgi:ribosomal protein S18 acetylase RimI-like enzyme